MSNIEKDTFTLSSRIDIYSNLLSQPTAMFLNGTSIPTSKTYRRNISPVASGLGSVMNQ